MRGFYPALFVVAIFCAATFSITHTSLSSDTHKSYTTCDRDTLRAAVQAASQQISDMKQTYKVALQKELSLLKQRKGWTNSEFLLKAKGLIQNEKISAYDNKSRQILSSIQNMGSGHVHVVKADCQIFSELQQHLDKVIETTKAKWEFMLQNIKATPAH